MKSTMATTAPHAKHKWKLATRSRRPCGPQNSGQPAGCVRPHPKGILPYAHLPLVLLSLGHTIAVTSHQGKQSTSTSDTRPRARGKLDLRRTHTGTPSIMPIQATGGSSGMSLRLPGPVKSGRFN